MLKAESSILSDLCSLASVICLLTSETKMIVT